MKKCETCHTVTCLQEDSHAPSCGVIQVDGGDDEPDIIEGDVDELMRELDKEEKEMDDTEEADDEDGEKLMTDIEKIEDAMEGEIKEMSKMAKPVRQVHFKVCPFFFLLSLIRSFAISSFFFPFFFFLFF